MKLPGGGTLPDPAGVMKRPGGGTPNGRSRFGAATGVGAFLHGAVDMKIKLISVYVDDHEKALRFYTEVLGFTKKADFSNGPYRWLTVVSPEDRDGPELQLALNDNPAAKAYQQALYQQGQPAVMLFTDDIKADHERIEARGGAFTMPPTDVTASTIAKLDDGCGNLIQLTQLARW